MILLPIEKRQDKTDARTNDTAKQTGVRNGAIARWSEKSPSIDKVFRVAKVLGCTVDDLIKDEPGIPA